MKLKFQQKTRFYELGWTAGRNIPTPIFANPTFHPEITLIFNQKGTFLFERPEKSYLFKPHSIGIYWGMIPFMISQVSLDNASAYITIPYQEMADAPFFNRIHQFMIQPSLLFYPNHTQDIKSLFLKWTQELRSAAYEREAAMLEIKAFLCRWNGELETKINSKATQEPTPLFQKLFLYIFKNFTQKISENKMAKDLSIHPKSISRCFKKATGMSFHQYLCRFRLQRAQSLLESSNEKITNIWMEAGFESSSSFYRNFKKTFGKSPHDYRDLINQ